MTAHGAVDRMFRIPSGSFFLFGPRGTGKSTWLKVAFRDALYVDLLNPATYRTYHARPERLIDAVEAARDVRTCVIDEVQRVPELLPAVHLLMERHKHIRFVLTGSSARKLKRTSADLLAGRAVLREFHPFLAAELGDLFKLEDALRTGLIPLVWSAPAADDALQAYIDAYIREEVHQEGLVRNIGGFSRFLEAVSFSHAAVLNTTAIARECEVERKAVENYISILEDLLLAWRLPVFAKRARRALIKHAKLYFFDAGLFRTLRPAGPLDKVAEAEGPALEGLVGQHLRAWSAAADATLHYWRTPSGNEVDFVVYGKGCFCAIEVKNARRVRPEDLKGLAAFREDYPEATLLLVYRGRERLKSNGVLCVPCAEFLREIVPGKPLPVR
jgi:predicted AAA+ superfamily ATPase